ncbi:FYVE, RhoGEF and PH domain-containing protein 6 [Smittium culicis]|uniref:FYVE, RhoGEF and PH domain-containing protein 6 n=1 Tax=Smittium culicis TaxID=133412 RepID=A0A1R1XRV2_9FUNG|nr:FYVE, RhoGEF and PH domain-containing protein 6 [Smittium culicis]
MEFLNSLSNRLDESLSNKKWDPESDLIGDITVKYFPFMKMYSLYLSNYADSQIHFDNCSKNNNFYCFIKNGESRPECAGLSFKSHLLLPVQRIPRYRLILKNILQNTSEDHPDYAFILKSYETIDKVADLVNDNIKEQEMILKILEIQKSLNVNEIILYFLKGKKDI